MQIKRERQGMGGLEIRERNRETGPQVRGSMSPLSHQLYAVTSTLMRAIMCNST